jgi:hypothetical protein
MLDHTRLFAQSRGPGRLEAEGMKEGSGDGGAQTNTLEKSHVTFGFLAL